MRSVIIVALAILVLLGIGYFVFTADSRESTSSMVMSDPALGLEFAYRGGAEGYVLQDMTAAENSAEVVKMLVLQDYAEATGLEPALVGGEGRPAITVAVLKNTKKQWPSVWASEHPRYSNSNLILGEMREEVVGGANAVRYMTDGLYRADTVVVAHGDYVYVFIGAFLDEDSAIRRDFQPLLDSVRFIPQV